MSYGQSLLRQFLERIVIAKFLENQRPEWLRGLELDFWFPDLKLGIEFQGDQHLARTKTFGDCGSQKRRDREKAQLCKLNQTQPRSPDARVCRRP